MKLGISPELASTMWRFFRQTRRNDRHDQIVAAVTSMMLGGGLVRKRQFDALAGVKQ
jgi:hypothetical protein